MSYPLSANVSAGDPTLSAHYNNLRSDALLLGQAAADAVTLAALLERYESRLTLERLSTDKIRVPASAAAPVSIVIDGFMVQATANVDLATGDKPAGVAAAYYVFANRVAGSTTFTLTVNTSITEGANQRLLGRFYWDGSAIVMDSVRTEQSILINSLLYFVEPQVCEGRLTLSTGEPIPSADVTSSGDIFYTPFTGSRIALYVENYGWRIYEFSELTLDVSGVGANQVFDIFIYDNAGTLTLSKTDWSNDTLRATSLVRQDGVLVKSGELGYRYLGTARTHSAGVVGDAVIRRNVWNYYNRKDRSLIVTDTTDSWTYNVDATWRAMNTSANNRVTFTIGVDDTTVFFQASVYAANSGAYTTAVGIGLDVTNANHAQILRNMLAVAGVKTWLTAQYAGNPGIGFHYLQIVEYQANGTATYYGDNAVSGLIASGGIGSISC